MNNKNIVFGHTNPDTDSIASAIVMANLQNKLGNETICYRLGDINKETAFALKTFGVDSPELLDEVSENANVIMVDSNEFIQSAKGIEKANIKMVVDHHRINLQTSEPLYYIAEPVGCTSTIIYKLYKQNDVVIDSKMAGLMLSAIISDTLLFKSPTCTEQDKKTAEKLAEIAGVDIIDYGNKLLKAGTDISDFSAHQVLNIDSKQFEEKGKKFVISQINSADLNDIFARKYELESAMHNELEEKKLDLYMFVATDILNANSKVIALGNDKNIVEKAYGLGLEDNTVLLENVVSRKKQILPKILENLQ
ncbi:MAG TPA: manganese-dependent inorganic pyrophosphatase [Clostridia bacterium]|nr:manganese-dependent inorganic pyrophosphatase [Clostridia bacterium]